MCLLLLCRYNDFYMTLFNILFTSLMPLAIGIFDRDVDRKKCIKYPSMYKQGAWNACASHVNYKYCTDRRLICVSHRKQMSSSWFACASGMSTKAMPA